MPTRFKIIFTTLILGLNFNFFSQTTIDSLKYSIKASLKQFIDDTKKVDSLKYINTFFLEQLLAKIDAKTTPKLYQLNSFNDLSIALSINTVDTSFSYEYMSYALAESFYKNCAQQTYASKGEPNLIYGSAGTFNLISVDTINNVIITKPTLSRYEVFRSTCPGGLSKEQASKVFMYRIQGQYQLVIYLNKVLPRAYFIVPPNPLSKIRIKHISGNF